MRIHVPRATTSRRDRTGRRSSRALAGIRSTSRGGRLLDDGARAERGEKVPDEDLRERVESEESAGPEKGVFEKAGGKTDEHRGHGGAALGHVRDDEEEEVRGRRHVERAERERREDREREADRDAKRFQKDPPGVSGVPPRRGPT